MDKGISQGAKLALKGKIQDNIISRHIFTEVDPESVRAKEESFGPILSVLKAQDETHALFLANYTEYGLSSAVCTQDYERGSKFTLGIEADMTHINDTSVDDQTIAPFGGEKIQDWGALMTSK